MTTDLTQLPRMEARLLAFEECLALVNQLNAEGESEHLPVRLSLWIHRCEECIKEMRRDTAD